MNQFRDLLMVGMIALAIGLEVGNPEDWGWIKLGGPYAVEALHFLIEYRPFDIVVLFALALAIFMTRLKY